MTTTQLSPWLSANLSAAASGETPTEVPVHRGKHSAGRRVRLDALEAPFPAPGSEPAPGPAAAPTSGPSPASAPITAATPAARAQVVTLDVERDLRAKRRAQVAEPAPDPIEPVLVVSTLLEPPAASPTSVAATPAGEPVAPTEPVAQAEPQDEPEPEADALDRTDPAPSVRRGGSHAARADDPVPVLPTEMPLTDTAADGMWPDLQPGRRTPAWTDVVDHEADLAFEISRAKDVVHGPIAGLPTGMHSPESWEPPVERSHRAPRQSTTRGRSRPVLFGLLGLLLGLAFSAAGLAVVWAVAFRPA